MQVLKSQSPAVRTGTWLFVLGLGFIAADIIWFWTGAHNTPLWLNLACLLAPIGFAVAVWSGLAAGRAEQREALRALSEQTGPQPRVVDRVAD